MVLEVTQGHRKWRYSIATYHFLLVICSNNVSILHRFRDVATFTLYVNVTALTMRSASPEVSWSLMSLFSTNMAISETSEVLQFQYDSACKHIVIEEKYINNKLEST